MDDLSLNQTVNKLLQLESKFTTFMVFIFILSTNYTILAVTSRKMQGDVTNPIKLDIMQ